MSSGNQPRHSFDKEKICVVIPAYQAQATIRPLVQEICRQGLSVIVIDDASTDETSAQARLPGVEIIRRSVNGGKGAALRDGLKKGLEESYEWILTMDADGQHVPSEIPRFLERAEEGGADIVIGNRMANPTGMPWDRRLTNRFMSWILSRMAGQHIPDTQCGFRLISREVLKTIPLNSDHFEIESELVVKAAKSGFKIASVPISSIYLGKTSFIRPIRDTIRFLRFLLTAR